MKKNVVIIFLFLMSLLAAETTKVNDEMITYEIPFYEKVPLISDYRINQPIKEAIRWGTAGMVLGLLGGYNYKFEKKYYDDSRIESAIPYAWEVCKVSMISGSIFGLYKGFIYQKQKRENPDYRLLSNKFGYECGLMLDPFISSDACMNKVIKSLTITYNHQYRFINEFQLSIDWVRWPDLEETRLIYEETKYDLIGIHYYHKNHIFSPYYGLGGGLSHGKRRHDDLFYDDTKILSQGLYPFIHTSAGIRFSILDFFYLKMETDFELSSFYLYARSHEDFSFLTNLTFGLVIGTKIF